MTTRIIIDNFLGGLAPSRYQGNPNGQFDPDDTTSAGFDPYVRTNEGLLRRGFGQATLTNASLMTGNQTWFRTASRTYGDFAFTIDEQTTGAGTNNRLMRIDTTTHTVSNSSPWPFTMPTDGGQTGLAFFNGYLYYASKRYLGHYDMSLTFNSSYYTFLGTTAIGRAIDHPMASGNGKLFFGNSNFSLNTASVGVDDGASVTPNALDLAKTEQCVRSIEFNRNTAFIAMTSNQGSGGPTGNSTMYVWDGIATSCQDKFQFPDEDFHCVKAYGSDILAFGQRGMYQFTGSGFDLIQPYQGGPDPWGVSVSNRGGVSWKDEATNFYNFGSPNKQLPTIVTKPIKFSEVPAGGVAYIGQDNMYVGGFTTAGSRIKRFGLAGTTYESGDWRTPMFKWDQPMRLVRFEVHMISMVSGCTLSATWANNDGSSQTTMDTMNTPGTTLWEYDPNGLVDYSWQFGITHSAGATPKIKRIILEVSPEKP